MAYLPEDDELFPHVRMLNGLIKWLKKVSGAAGIDSGCVVCHEKRWIDEEWLRSMSLFWGNVFIRLEMRLKHK